MSRDVRWRADVAALLNGRMPLHEFLRRHRRRFAALLRTGQLSADALFHHLAREYRK